MWKKTDEQFGFCLMKRLESSDETLGSHHEHVVQCVCVCMCLFFRSQVRNCLVKHRENYGYPQLFYTINHQPQFFLGCPGTDTIPPYEKTPPFYGLKYVVSSPTKPEFPWIPNVKGQWLTLGKYPEIIFPAVNLHLQRISRRCPVRPPVN